MEYQLGICFLTKTKTLRPHAFNCSPICPPVSIIFIEMEVVSTLRKLKCMHPHKKVLKNFKRKFGLKFLRTSVLFVGPLIPLFWTSGDIAQISKSGWISYLCASLPCQWIPQIHLWCDTCWPVLQLKFFWSTYLYTHTSISGTQTWDRVCSTVCSNHLSHSASV